MSLSRSPSPRHGGGWASPGLTSPFDTMGGSSSPRKTYGDIEMNGHGNRTEVTWSSVKARSEEVRSYPSFSTRNTGFFSRNARKISSSLPRFNLGGRNYAEKEKLGRGRWIQNPGGRYGRLNTFCGNVLRKMKLRLMVTLALAVIIILFCTTRESQVEC